MGAPVPDGIWLPDLCRLPRLLTMLGLAQLTVVLVMLVPMATPPWDGAQFVSASGYALWLALSVSVLLCAGRKRLSRLPMRVGATAALGLALTVAVIMSLAAGRLASAEISTTTGAARVVADTSRARTGRARTKVCTEFMGTPDRKLGQNGRGVGTSAMP